LLSDTLILALPVSWKGSLIQYVGRIQLDYKGKEEVKVIDYIDAKIPMLLRMFNKREKGYRALGFSLESIIQQQFILPRYLTGIDKRCIYME